MIAALVLAAGHGTRLRPLTDDTPKPLLWVGDGPLLSHIIRAIAPLNPRRIVVNAHHCAHEIAAYLDAHSLAPSLSHEVELLGTGGALNFTASSLGQGDVLVWNGDILGEIDAASLVRAHQNDPNAPAATLAISPRRLGEGNVGVGRDRRIVRLREETFGPGEQSGGDFVAVSVVGNEARALAPERGCMVGDVYMPALRNQLSLSAFEVRGPWFDIGSIRSFADANAWWLTKNGVDAYVSPKATIGDRVTVKGAVIADGAIVNGWGEVRCSVILPEAQVVAPIYNCVALRNGMQIEFV